VQEIFASWASRSFYSTRWCRSSGDSQWN